HINITNAHYGALDPRVLKGVDEDDLVHYMLSGYDEYDNLIWGPVASIDEPGAPEVCQITCHSIHYAWQLRGYGNGAIASMGIYNGTQDGSYFYFYMKESDFWGTWSLFPGNTPTHYGFSPGSTWTD